MEASKFHRHGSAHMKWRKIGRIYSPEPVHPKLLSHAANPLPVQLDGDIYRVFFSGRDIDNKSSVGYVDVNIKTCSIIRVCEQPAFQHGPVGSFFEHGVSIGNCYAAGGSTYMLFMGWQNPPQGHWRGDIGRLKLGDDLKLSLDSSAPFMGSDGIDPVSLSYPWVMHTGVNYSMWYGSTVTWDAGNSEMVHVINQADSPDGHVWTRKGLAIPFKVGVAQAFSHPTVVGNEAQGYEMWFSYRSGTGQPYRIGYARKPPGLPWDLRLDQAGIDVSDSGWDSEMIEYPFVLNHDGQRLMLYNGNGNGKTGFGLAVLEAD